MSTYSKSRGASFAVWKLDRVYRTATTLLVIFVAQATFAEPPSDFLEQCKAETVRFKIKLSHRMREAPTAEKKGIQAELKAIQQGKLVAPKLLALMPGAIGRAPVDVGALHVVAINNSHSATVDLPLTVGTSAGIEKDASPLDARFLHALYDDPGGSQRIILEDVSTDKLTVVPINGKAYRYIEMPETLEVVGTNSEGMMVVRPFDLNAWTKAQKTK
jgi:hypothetical protein